MITTTDFDNKQVFLKTEVGQIVGVPVRCNHVIIVFSLEGDMKVELNYSVYHVKQHSLLLLSPLDIVTIKEYSFNYRSLALVLPLPLFSNWILSQNIDFYEKLRNAPVFNLYGKELDVVRGMFDVLSTLKEHFDYKYFEMAVEGAIKVLYPIYLHHIEKYENYETKGSVQMSRKRSLFRKFVKQLVASHHKSREVLFYANELGVSSGYLNEVCNEISSYSAKDIIDTAVSSRLKYELSYTDKSIQELADEFNFPSQSYFSRYYKRMTGQSPSDFRKNRTADEML